jgi:hypothetical protein
MENGANTSALPASRYGRTALQALCYSENPSSELMAFLIDRGVDINAPAADLGGLTAIPDAALMGNTKIAMILAGKGAYVNAHRLGRRAEWLLTVQRNMGVWILCRFLTFGASCMAPGASGYDSAAKFAEDNSYFPIAVILRGYNRQAEGELFDISMC